VDAGSGDVQITNQLDSLFEKSETRCNNLVFEMAKNDQGDALSAEEQDTLNNLWTLNGPATLNFDTDISKLDLS